MCVRVKVNRVHASCRAMVSNVSMPQQAQMDPFLVFITEIRMMALLFVTMEE